MDLERGVAPTCRRPRAARIPRPPSVVALPPTPRSIRRTPRRGRPAAPRRCRTWRLRAGSRSAAARRDSPDAAASSTTARVPSAEASQRASIARPSGSWAAAARHSQPPAASIATAVPSPPSASGARRISSPGRAASQPAARARATSTDVSEPLKESGRHEDRQRPAATEAGSADPGPAALTRPAPPARRSRYSGIRIIGGRSRSASSMTSRPRWSSPKRGSFIVEPSSAKRRARRRSSSRFMTAWRMTKLIRESPSSSWLRWIRRSRSTWPSPSRPARSAMSIRWPISTA